MVIPLAAREQDSMIEVENIWRLVHKTRGIAQSLSRVCGIKVASAIACDPEKEYNSRHCKAGGVSCHRSSSSKNMPCKNPKAGETSRSAELHRKSACMQPGTARWPKFSTFLPTGAI